MGLARRQPTKHVRYRNTHMPHGRTPATLTWVNRYDLLVIYGDKPSTICSSMQHCFARQWRVYWL